MRELTVWMNMPSPYQVDLFRTLVATGRVDLEVVYARGLGADRRGLGWTTDLEGYRSTTLPSQRSWRHALRLAREQSRRFHIVNGIWAESAFTVALLALGHSRTPHALYAEAPNPTLPRPRLKSAVRRKLAHHVAGRALGFLTVSHFAEHFYQSVGFRAEQIYPFGYFRNAPPARGRPGTEVGKASGRTHLVFIGQIIQRKGIHLFWQAVRPLLQEHPGLTVTFVGEGAERPALLASIAAEGLTDRVVAPGAQPYEQVYETLAGADALVLPSYWDGWGLVVNEALAAGVPAIVSDHCGVSDLIHDDSNGYTFPAGSVEGLAGALSRFLTHPDRQALRAGAAATGATLSTDVAAEYLLDCVEHMATGVGPRPVPPWLATAPNAEGRPR